MKNRSNPPNLHTVGLGHDFREPECGSFDQYLIFFDDLLCDHPHNVCTLRGKVPIS